MQVEDRLTASFSDVDDHPVVLEAGRPGCLGDELEHPLGLVGRELRDLPKRVDVALRDDEQVRLGFGVDVAHGDEALGRANVLALAHELTEEAVLRQRESLRP